VERWFVEADRWQLITDNCFSGLASQEKDFKEMSRIGKKLIPLPAGVKYKVEGNTVLVEGPKGKVTALIADGITLKTADGNLQLERASEDKAAVHGLTRALVNNAVHGVTKGWTRELDIVGIGYRAELKGKGTVVFTLGYSHPIEVPLPSGIEVTIDPKQTHLTVMGVDRQKVGQVAADMRSLRKPDPYKNKGVRYSDERLKKKAGKTGAK
jgi:large subunit ribosomal protein L6